MFCAKAAGKASPRCTEEFRVFKKGDLLILLAAFLSFLFSVSLWFGFGMQPNKEAGIFVGLWVPSILGTGIYVQQVAQRLK